MQHVQIDETTPVQVVDSYKQLTRSRQGEQLQDQEFGQEIEQALEQMDTIWSKKGYRNTLTSCFTTKWLNYEFHWI